MTLEEIEKELWKKFKSPLGRSSINNKNNSMYDLEDFVKNTVIREVLKEILFKFGGYSDQENKKPYKIKHLDDRLIKFSKDKYNIDL